MTRRTCGVVIWFSSNIQNDMVIQTNCQPFHNFTQTYPNQMLCTFQPISLLFKFRMSTNLLIPNSYKLNIQPLLTTNRLQALTYRKLIFLMHKFQFENESSDKSFSWPINCNETSAIKWNYYAWDLTWFYESNWVTTVCEICC